jgi:hypothetical protein
MAGLVALCTHVYVNRDISHMDGFAGGNEIRGVQVQRAHAAWHFIGQPAAGSADGGRKEWTAPPLTHSATNLVVSADGPVQADQRTARTGSCPTSAC